MNMRDFVRGLFAPPPLPKKERDFTPRPPQPDELLTAKEVSRLLNVPVPTIYNWGQEKRIHTYRSENKPPKPRVFYYKAEIEQILNGQHKLLELKRRD